MKKVTYRFNVERPLSMDATIFKLIRYTWDDDGGDDFGPGGMAKMEVLTNDGWVEFRAYEILHVGSLPTISGHDQIDQGRYQHALDTFEQRIREILRNAI